MVGGLARKGIPLSNIRYEFFGSADELLAVAPKWHAYYNGCCGDLVRRFRPVFRGIAGTGCQLAIMRTQSRALALSVMPGKCRRSSTTAENSPLSL